MRPSMGMVVGAGSPVPEVAKARCQAGERLGEEMPNEQAKGEREYGDWHQKEERQGPQSEREMRHRDCEDGREDGEQRC